MQKEYDKHLMKKETMCKLKDDAKQDALENNTHASAVFDVEVMLTNPKTVYGDAHYMCKLDTHNFTMYNCESKKEVFRYLWPEYVASRGSNEVASCMFDYLSIMAERKVDKFSLLSDSCAEQHKNHTYGPHVMVCS
ncbi:organic cation transporter protein [Plakobranchus ocellatus]|uniref:Organic cation transporter protein n=1 Tax=Plakobranchus ocellatus TaxID=259542 RepID=A0AAV3Z4U5_9GAST|nr:organic cation transporter protein [Plakobranchus ocellatus]